MKSVADVMTRYLFTVAPLTTVRLARQLTRERGVRHLLVTAEDELLGVLCACDLNAASDASAPVAKHMRPNPFTTHPLATLSEAAAIMRAFRIGCLPVERNGRIVGIVTRGDLERAGVSDDAAGIRRCAACGYRHNLRADRRCAEILLCGFCEERSLPGGEELDAGGGD